MSTTGTQATWLLPDNVGGGLIAVPAATGKAATRERLASESLKFLAAREATKGVEAVSAGAEPGAAPDAAPDAALDLDAPRPVQSSSPRPAPTSPAS